MTALARNPVFSFTVSGSGIFPLDMLRYDECYPIDTDTANAIAASIDQDTRYSGRRTFRLRGNMRYGPAVKRWESFGFSVSDIEEVR